jgi:hypothetical protein
MKYLTTILFLLLIIGCQKSKVLTYAEGLENCNRIQKEKQKDNPNAFLLEDADCIVGSQIPEFEATTIEGKKINRELLKGNLVLSISGSPHALHVLQRSLD